MPVDPNISLNIATPQMGGQLGQAGGGLAMVGQFAQIQNAMNQTRLFNERWQAMHAAGELYASSPDPETGYARVMASPYAPYVGDFLTQMRQARLLDIQAGKETASAADTALTAAYKATFNAALDPHMTRQQFDSFAAPVINGIPPGPIRDAAARQWGAYGESLFGGATPQQRQQKAVAMAMAHGLSPEQMYSAAGAVAPSVQTFTGPQGQQIPGVLSGGGLMGPPSFQQIPLMGGQQPTGGQPQGGPLAPTGGQGQTGGGLMPGGAASGGIVGPTIEQKAYAEENPKQLFAYQDKLDERVKAGGLLMQQVAQVRDLMKKVPTGPETSWREPAANFLSSLGVSDDLVNKVRGGDFASGQELAKYFLQTAVGQMAQQLPAGSRFNLREFEAAIKSNPNVAMKPEAVDGILNYWTKLYQIDQAEQGAFSNYQGDARKWGAIWTKHIQDTGMLPVKPNITGEAKGEEPQVPKAAPAPRPKVGDFFKGMQ